MEKKYIVCRLFIRMGEIILGLLALVPLAVSAQLTVNPQLTVSGLVQKDGLWNLALENSGVDLGVNIKLSLKDATTGQTILFATTGNLNLVSGEKFIRARDLQPITYLLSRSDLSGQYLPQGSYLACYQVFQNIQTPLLLAQQCITVKIDPIIPPVLNGPVDNGVLDDFNPAFSWTPPTPIGIFDSLTYSLKVAQVLAGQSPREAIEYNTPLFMDSTVKSSDVYPSLAQKLTTGLLYAWQVTVRNGTKYHAKTDVRTFSIMTDEKQKVLPEKSEYILLLPQAGDSYEVHNEPLLARLYSFAPQSAAPFVFTDGQGNVVSKGTNDLVLGENTFAFNLGSNFQAGNTYKLAVTGYNGQNYFLSFTIK